MAQIATNRFKLLLILIMATHSAFGYHWGALDPEITDDFVCNNQTCDGRPHSSCLIQQPVNQTNCNNLGLKRLITLSHGDIRMLLQGHNGLRNRIAQTYYNETYHKRVANMNLLHWDSDLQHMAEGWIKQCLINTDPCDFIHSPHISIGQNIRFESAEHLSSLWIIQIVKHWFLQGVDEKDPKKAANFTQMMWPHAEFMGCAAALYIDGYMLACNYHPKANVSSLINAVIVEGTPCSKCPRRRPGCSHIFTGLCGIDIPFDGSRSVQPAGLRIFILALAVCIFYNFG